MTVRKIARKPSEIRSNLKGKNTSFVERTLWRILQTIVAIANIEELLGKCQQDLAHLINCDFVNIYIYDHEKNTLSLLGIGYHAPHLFKEMPPVLEEVALSVPIGQSVSGRTLKTGQSQTVYNLQEDSTRPPEKRQYFWTDFVKQTGVEGILSVAIPGASKSTASNIAVINLYTRNQKRIFSEEDIEQVEKAAHAIGQKLSMLRDREELQAYREVARITEANVLLQDTLDRLAQCARQQTFTLAADIFLLKESEAEVNSRSCQDTCLCLVGSTGIISADGEPLTDYEKAHYKYQDGITGWAAYHRKLVRVTDKKDLEQQKYSHGMFHLGKYLHPDIPQETEHINLIVAPIMANERFYGVIRVIGRENNLPVGTHSQNILKIIADQLGIRLAAHERAEEQEERIKKARHTLASIFQMGIAGKEKEKASFLEVALQCAMNAIGAEAGAITFYAPILKQLEFQVYLPEMYCSQALKTPLAEDNGDWPICLAFQKQRIQNIPDIHIAKMKTIHPDVHACLAVPITLQGTRIGVIACCRIEVGAFETESVQTLEGIALYIANLVLNRQLRDDLQKELRIRNDFLAIAAHQMASPIAAMESHCKILNNPETMTEERWQKVRQIIANSCQLTTNILYQFTAVREVIDREDFPITKKPVRLSQLLIATAALYQPSAWRKNMEIHVERTAGLDMLPEISADSKILPQVFTNLLDNAIKYSKKGTRITIPLHKRTPTSCCICVHNIGIPIEEGEKERIFDREYRSDFARIYNQVGNGLGLPIARAIIKRHGGAIFVQSEPHEEDPRFASIRFYVDIPF